ncbi:MAG: hypothetical protein ABJ000_07710 [Saccharospirillum sp.]|uniref:hypothetical protein n=1 Tax=Saccharospirillum sp. TaxID=2033801 RepID=UPI003299E2BB
MIEPFFFDDERLFGSYFSSTDPYTDKVVILCPPLFDEYRRTYRALSELAMAIAERGAHAFRFDYYGTGESQGDLAEATIEGWLSDIETSIAEAVAVSGASQVVLLGVRFGATLAAQNSNPQVKSRLFWDPVISGNNYLDWLNEIDQILYTRHKAASRSNNVAFENIDYKNFDLPEQLTTRMSQVTIQDSLLSDPHQCFTVSTDPDFCQQQASQNCIYAGLPYDWPYYHDGVITQKPVLEALLNRVVA